MVSGIFIPWPGMETVPEHWKHTVLTAGPPRNSQDDKFELEVIVLYLFYFLKHFFIWTIFKVFTEFVTILLLLSMFWFFGYEVCGISTPPPGSKPAPQLWKVKS